MRGAFCRQVGSAGVDERAPAASTSGSGEPSGQPPDDRPTGEPADRPAGEPAPRSSNEIVHAAGGIIVRNGGTDGTDRPGGTEIALVHRPHREDWTFPKGKLEPGETFEECALREVLEETGLECRLVAFAGHTEYQDRKDRLKVVAYWTMEAAGDRVDPNWEVDEVRWVTPEVAASLLTYERDRELLVSLAPLTTAPSGT